MSTIDPAKEEIIQIVNNLLERSGLSIEQVLARMQASGCDISRNSFENRFTTRVRQKPNIPPQWILALIHAFTHRLSDSERCRADEAIRLASLARLPLEQLFELYTFFPEEEFTQALKQYISPLMGEIVAAPPADTRELVQTQTTQPPQAAVSAPSVAPQVAEWGDAPDVTPLFGRAEEVETLVRWITAEQCRMIGIFGLGGIGKTALIRTAVEQAHTEFDFLIWHSLRNAPAAQDILEESLQMIGEQPENIPGCTCAKPLKRLLRQLRAHRCLLILDGFESVLREGDGAGEFRSEHEEYSALLQQFGEVAHQSCLLITSREKPDEFALQTDYASPIRSLELEGIHTEPARQLLAYQQLYGSDAEWHQLVTGYSGNPMALKLVSEPIHEIYGGDIARFLNSGISIFGGVRELLEDHFSRISRLERSILYWLAIEREAITLAVLLENLAETTSELRVVEALRALRRRSLIEQNASGLTLPNVVMEYLLDRLVHLICAEIDAELPMLLDSFALSKVQTKEHIRRNQMHLLIDPILNALLQPYRKPQLVRKLCTMLAALPRISFPDERTSAHPGYAAGNLLNLLARLNADLRGLDLSRLAICQADLRGLDLQDVNLTDAWLVDSVFTENFGSVTAVAFGPRGRLVAAGTANGDVRIWPTDDRQQVIVCTGHTDFVWDIAFSPDGRFLATSSSDHSVRLWEVETGALLEVFTGHTNWVKGVSFSHDGIFLASCGNDGVICIWNCETGDCLTAFTAHAGWVWAVAFSPDTYLLASVGQDGLVKLWDTAADECVEIWDQHEGPVRTVAFSPDGQWIASGGFDHNVHLWNPATGESQTLTGHTGFIWCVAFSPDGQMCASGSDDQTVRFWRLSDGAALRTLNEHHNRVWSIDFSPDGDTLVSGSDDQTIRFWHVATGQSSLMLEGHSAQIWALGFHPQRNTLISGGDTKKVQLWPLPGAESTSEPLAAFTEPTDRIRSLAVDNGSSLLAAGGDDRVLRLWNLATQRCMLELSGHTNRIWAVAINPSAPVLASGSEDQTIRLWSIPNGRCFRIIRLQQRVWSLSFSPDGATLASATDDDVIRIWDVQTGQCIQKLRGHADRVWQVAFHPHGDRVASAGDDGDLRLWNMASGACLQTFTGHADSVHALTFSLDGRRLASGSADQTARVWDVQTGACQGVLVGHAGSVRAVTFGPDQTLFSGGSDETIRMWDLAQHECVHTLRASRPYERMNITGLHGLTPAQKNVLKLLGAIEHPIEE